ncbi:MAG: hypothetical protein SWE60_13965 [Thermodesulfobacteriota bacterium]|nr:hypothetical protein [Thermodesulfobacteriota bacterium]
MATEKTFERPRLATLVLALAFWFAIVAAGEAGAATLELYGTFHAMGVIVELEASDDPDQDAVAAVAYRSGTEDYHAGFPLSRVTETRLVGSLFWLEPGIAYDVRVVFSDPDGGLDGAAFESSASTRAEIVIPAPLHSFYVSPDGKGSGCTTENPCSLSQGLSMAQPGDEVVLLEGVYYEGDSEIPRSGTLEAPIVIRGLPDKEVVLDGADPTDFAWEDQGGGCGKHKSTRPILIWSWPEMTGSIPTKALATWRISPGAFPASMSTAPISMYALSGTGIPTMKRWWFPDITRPSWWSRTISTFWT